jgi:hypothetical protein
MGDYDVPEDWFDSEVSLFDDLIGSDPEIGGDEFLQTLFDMAMFNEDMTPAQRDAAYQNLIDYLEDEYDIDFEDVFDWEDYRDWYDAA